MGSCSTTAPPSSSLQLNRIKNGKGKGNEMGMEGDLKEMCLDLPMALEEQWSTRRTCLD